jgi:hypothetical protein
MKVLLDGLDVKARDRLTRLCGKFGSDCESERSFAALSADKLIHDAGLTWADIIGLIPVAGSASTGDHNGLCVAALAVSDLLDDVEREFLRSISRLNTISPKQRAWLDRIVSRIRKEAA